MAGKGGLARRFVERRFSGLAILLVGAGALVLCLIFSPDLGSFGQRKDYQPFFAASAGLVAAMFIALSVESDYVSSSPGFALSAVAGLGISAVAAVVGLLPRLGECVYTLAFAATVGGGVAGLLSVCIVAAGALTDSRRRRREENLHRALERFGGTDDQTSATQPPSGQGTQTSA